MKNKRKNPPKVLEYFLKKITPFPGDESLVGDYEESYMSILKNSGKIKAYIWYLIHVIKLMPSYFEHRLYWSYAMFKNYLKTALRNFRRQKGYTFINIFGLTAGLICFIFIFLYVRYELSYDSFHKDADRIFRITSSIKTATGTNNYGGAAPALTPYIKENFPRAEYVTRYWREGRDHQVEYGNRIFKEEAKYMYYVDEDIFKIFTFDFKQGDSNTALMRPNTAVITNETAKKYFGEGNALGETIIIGGKNFEITGITEELPGNSIFRFKILKSWKTIEGDPDYENQLKWWGGYRKTFIKLSPGVNPVEFEQLITNAVVNHAEENIKREKSEYKASLQPLKKIHLHSNYIFDFDPDLQGNILYIYIFSGIAVFILLIACINFINLATARSTGRAGEIGIRKVVGALRKQLINQFFLESFLIVLVSIVLAVSTVIFLLPEFNKISYLKIKYYSLLNTDFLICMLMIMFFTGLVSGGYPALLLSSFRPVSVLRGKLRAGTKGVKIRKILVVGQFTLSVILVIGAIIFNQQLNFMKNKSLGFDKEQKLIIDMQDNRFRSAGYSSVKGEFSRIPSVTGASFSTSIPGKWRFNWKIWPTGQEKTNAHLLNVMAVDEDFLSLYNIELIAGRNFRPGEVRGLTWIINETAVNTYGWYSNEEALKNTLMDHEPYTKIVGIIKDYHFFGLQNTIEPLALYFTTGGYRYLTLKLNTQNLEETLSLIEQKYKSLFPGKYYVCYFLDDNFNMQYLKEERISRIFNIFTFLGVFIACLDLFGLTSFIVNQRTKEIGIRKVMGASVQNVLILLSKEYIKWILISNLVAWPVAFYTMNKILQDFAYRINIGCFPFLISAFLAVAITLLTVSWHSVKVAYTNPVNSLRYE